jgi:outer membrane scaffolding protein for murein synthesis (MipA/OmpV family)
LRLLASTLAIALPACQAAEAPAEPERPWSLSLMAGALRVPDFEGSRTSHNQFAIGFEASYRTEDFGTFSAGRKGLSWAPIETGTLRAGLALDGDDGREEHNPSGFWHLASRPGAERLKGLGRLSSTPMLGVFAEKQFLGISASAKFSRATRDNRGSLVQLGLARPIPLGEKLTTTPSLSLTWADDQYMQAHYGVTAGQAAASHCPAFQAKAGIKSVDASLLTTYPLNKNWSLLQLIGLSHLTGDAGHTPITEKRTLLSTAIGISYAF